MTRRRVGPWNGLGALLFLSGLLAFESCAPTPAEAWDPRAGVDPGRHLELAPATARAVEPVRVALQQLPDARWTVTPADAGSVERPPTGGEEVFLLPGARGQAKALTIPGPFDPARFQRVVVHFTTRGSLQLDLSLSAAGETLGLEEPHPFDSNDQPQTLIFDLPDNASRTVPFDALTLSVEGAHRSFWVHSVDFLARPLEHWLPSATDGPQLVTCGEDARRGVAVLADGPLVSDLTVPAKGRLVFSYARPPAVPDPGAPATLSCTVESNGEVVRRDFALDTERGWTEATLDLARFEGRAVRARFAVDAAVPCVVADAMVETPHELAPTIVLITSDTHRADHLAGAEGAVDIDTPTLAALAERGLRFERAQSSTNITLPSHVSIFTGLSPRDTGLTDNRDRLDESAPTLADVFHAAGWSTIAVVSMRHLGPEQSGLGQGFARYSTPLERERNALEAVALALAQLELARGRPVFLWLHVNDAHSPYAPPEPWARRYWSETHDPYDPELPDPSGPPPPEDWRLRDYGWARAKYRGEISFLDAALEPLFELDRVQRGVVAFTADHGESLGDVAIGWGHEGIYPAELRVPLILTWPGAQAGARSARPTDQLDLGRTLLELAGLKRSEFPGQGLVGVVRPADTPPDPLFALSSGGLEASITLGFEHLILGLTDDPRRRPIRNRRVERHRVWLFDLERDPECVEELANARPERARALRAALIEWLSTSEARDWQRRGDLDGRALRELAELGYAEDTTIADASGPWFETDDCEHCRRWR